MKKVLLTMVVLLFSGIFITAGATEYGFDKAHTHIGFSVRHILSPVPGEFKDYDGSFSFDPKKPETAKIKVTIQAASISTGNEMRDKHLQSPDFFDVEKYPTLIFVSKSVAKGDGDSQYKVTGDLTMHGVTKSVVLDADYMGEDTMPMDKEGKMTAKIVGFSATTKIDRRDFKLDWGQDKLSGGKNLMVGNDVTITLDIAGMDKTSLGNIMHKMKAKSSENSKK